MDNNLLILKVRERLNKISSVDYDNIEKWQIAEAFNKAQIETVRRIIGGRNPLREGDEQSKTTVDDIQILLKEEKLIIRREKDDYYSAPVPEDYLSFKRLQASAKSDCCPPRRMMIYQAEEANVGNLLRDEDTKPSFDWAETFCTLIGNSVRIYVDETFKLSKSSLIYYRMPRKVSFSGTVDPETGQPGKNRECELKRDLIEIIVDEAVSILAGDIGDPLQYQRNSQQAQRNV